MSTILLLISFVISSYSGWGFVSALSGAGLLMFVPGNAMLPGVLAVLAGWAICWRAARRQAGERPA
jgi:hypothetical protein